MTAALKKNPENIQVNFSKILKDHNSWPLTRSVLSELQINLGKLCNQACNHCHVDAGPKRTEIMEWDTIEKILAWSQKAGIKKVDLTGGAPEMNPHFRKLVDAFIKAGVQVTSRCNLSILLEPGYEDMVDWYAERKIRLVCSLPCYTKENVDKQRGKGVFNKSITTLKLLNAAGYGLQDKLPLDLVYNPGDAFLPPEQTKLESDYRQRLTEDFGISFSSLLTITNLPISRFKHYLEKTGQSQSYQDLLLDSFNAQTIPGLMCRHLVSIDWQGFVFDCDFNQMIDIPLSASNAIQLWDLDDYSLHGNKIGVGNHCFGCTAGAGSSCGGSLA
jgi:radical SAM/Cys-rich protein